MKKTLLALLAAPLLLSAASKDLVDLQVYPKDARLLIQGVNMVKRHTRPSQMNPGGIVDKEAPIHVSNISHVDPVGGKAVRVGFMTLEDNRKVRVARRSGEMID